MRGRRASAEARTPLPQRIAAGAFVVPGACAGWSCREVCAGDVCGRCVPGTCAGGVCRLVVPGGVCRGDLPKRAEERDEPPAEGARGVGRSEDLFRSGLRLQGATVGIAGHAGSIGPIPAEHSGGAENLSCCGALWPCRRAARRDGLRLQGATGGTAGHAGSIAQAPAEHSGGAAGCRGLRKVSPATSPERIRAGPETRPSAPRRRRAGACRRPCRSARHAPACG